MTDPLFDTLFRPTTVPAAIASALPVRITGTRTRAGNAMNRTRGALLVGTRRAVEIAGTKITMSQVASASGVAKATLYNHFRTREALLSALVLDEVTSLVESCADLSLADALATAANALAEHRVLRALARMEPATLAELARINFDCEAWRAARNAVASAVAGESRGGAELVLRWLSSYLLTPANAEAIAADLAILQAALPDVVAGEASLGTATELGA
jgi:AcrR family transcriptional regulator